MCRECCEHFPRHRLQRKPIASDPSMHHGTCVTHACMSGSLSRGGGKNVPGIPGSCDTRNFTYLARGPLRVVHSIVCLKMIHHPRYTRNDQSGSKLTFSAPSPLTLPRSLSNIWSDIIIATGYFMISYYIQLPSSDTDVINASVTNKTCTA